MRLNLRLWKDPSLPSFKDPLNRMGYRSPSVETNTQNKGDVAWEESKDDFSYKYFVYYAKIDISFPAVPLRDIS